MLSERRLKEKEGALGTAEDGEWTPSGTSEVHLREPFLHRKKDETKIVSCELVGCPVPVIQRHVACSLFLGICLLLTGQ